MKLVADRYRIPGTDHRVEYRGSGGWAALYHGHSRLGVDSSTWTHEHTAGRSEPLPSYRTLEWISAHRFPSPEAALEALTKYACHPFCAACAAIRDGVHESE
jgi:hypothetical protein